MTILFGLFAFVLVVAFHEFGHFAVARLFKVPVDVFSIGFGRRLFGFKLWGADFRVSSLPLGGYVRFRHEEGPASVSGKSRYAQVCIHLAGIAMNLVLAVVLFTAALMAGGQYVANDGTGVYIENVVPGMPAARAGLLPEDMLNGIVANGRSYAPQSLSDVSDAVNASEGAPVQVRVRRGLSYQTFTLTPVPDARANGYALGVVLGGGKIKGLPFSVAFPAAADITWRTVANGLTFVPREVAHIFATADGSRMSGPVGIMHAASKQTRLGLLTSLFFIASLSIGLATINLLPVPPLDGWHALKTIFEGVSRRSIPQHVETVLSVAGVLAVIALTFIIGASDIIKMVRS